MNVSHTDPRSEDNEHHGEYNKKRDQQSQDPAPIVQIGDMTCIKQTNLSPMDPRNWSRFRKEAAFAVIVFGSCACGAIGPLLVPGFTTVAADLGVSLTQVTLLNGSLVMALGVSAYIANALATTYGTRLIFLVTTIALAATCCWGAAARSYGSLLAARVFQGVRYTLLLSPLKAILMLTNAQGSGWADGTHSLVQLRLHRCSMFTSEDYVLAFGTLRSLSPSTSLRLSVAKSSFH